MITRAISLVNAEDDKLFYFVTTIAVYRGDTRTCLILKRDQNEKVLPGKWALPGERLSWSDFDTAHPDTTDGMVLNFNRPIEKHVVAVVKDKAGITVDTRPHYLESIFFVRPDDVPSMLVRFAVEYTAGEVAPQHGFTDFAWVDADELTKYDHVDGIDQDILKTITLFS